MALLNLPRHTLEHVLGFITAEELISVSGTCRYLYCLVDTLDEIWKSHCEAVWVCDKLDMRCEKWRQQWVLMCSEFGRYRKCYAGVKKAWMCIEAFLRPYNNMGINHSELLADGATEEEIQSAESELGFTLPLEYRCSLRLHNGQSHGSPSFMGSMLLGPNRDPLFRMIMEYHEVKLLPLSKAVSYHVDMQRFTLESYMVIAETVIDDDAHCVLLSLEGCKKNSPGNVVQAYTKLSHNAIPVCCVYIIGEARSFKDWLMEHAQTLPCYPLRITRRHTFNILRCNQSTATTGYFTVTVLINIDPRILEITNTNRYVIFDYKISITMHEDAPESDTCQAVTMQWYIKDSVGNEKHNDVTIQDKVTPGCTLEWGSTITLEQNCEYKAMYGGLYTMRRLSNNETFSIRIPEFTVTMPSIELCAKNEVKN